MTQRLIVLTAALMLVSCAARSDNAYSGTLQKPSAAVGSTLGGRVVRVMVSEGSPVRAGAALLARRPPAAAPGAPPPWPPGPPPPPPPISLAPELSRNSSAHRPTSRDR